MMILIPATLIGLTILSAIGWGLVEVVVQMFRRHDFKGIKYYDGGSKFDMAGWFEPIPADKFYGYN